MGLVAHSGTSTCQIAGATFLGLGSIFPNISYNIVLVEVDPGPSDIGLDTLGWEAAAYEPMSWGRGNPVPGVPYYYPSYQNVV